MPWIDFEACEFKTVIFERGTGLPLGVMLSRRRAPTEQEQAWSRRFLTRLRSNDTRNESGNSPEGGALKSGAPKGTTRPRALSPLNVFGASGAVSAGDNNKRLGEQRTMANEEPNVNTVTISGIVKKLQFSEGKFFALIDTGLDKWIPVTGHEKESNMEPGLMGNLLKFEEGDRITFRGYARPWSQKKDNNEWKNGLDIRITHLKPGTIPNRQPKQAQQSGGTPAGW